MEPYVNKEPQRRAKKKKLWNEGGKWNREKFNKICTIYIKFMYVIEMPMKNVNMHEDMLYG